MALVHLAELFLRVEDVTATLMAVSSFGPPVRAQKQRESASQVLRGASVGHMSWFHNDLDERSEARGYSHPWTRLETGRPQEERS
jgi:hypothetical protein